MPFALDDICLGFFSYGKLVWLPVASCLGYMLSVSCFIGCKLLLASYVGYKLLVALGTSC